MGRGVPRRSRRERAKKERGSLTTMRKACLGSRQAARPMSSAGGRHGVTGVDDRTEGGDIALKSEAKDGMELEKSGEQGAAEQSIVKQSKAKRAKRIESGITHRDKVARQAEIGRLTSWQGQVGHLLCGTGQSRTGAQDTLLEKF